MKSRTFTSNDVYSVRFKSMSLFTLNRKYLISYLIQAKLVSYKKDDIELTTVSCVDLCIVGKLGSLIISLRCWLEISRFITLTVLMCYSLLALILAVSSYAFPPLLTPSLPPPPLMDTTTPRLWSYHPSLFMDPIDPHFRSSIPLQFRNPIPSCVWSPPLAFIYSV